jgi:GAF domain-containing protein
MQTPKNQPSEFAATQIKRSFYVSIGSSILFAVSLVLVVLTSTSGPILGLTDLRVLLFGLTVSCLISAGLSRLGGRWVLMGQLLVLFILSVIIMLVVVLIEGVGPAAAIVLVVVVFGIASFVFPPRQSSRMIIGGIVYALIVLAIDLFFPLPRASNNTPELTWFLTGVFLLFFGVLISRQFNSYALRTKLIIVMVGITLVATLAITIYGISATTRSLTQTVGQQLSSNASSMAAQVGNIFEEQLSILGTLSINELLQQVVQEHTAGYGTTDPAAITAEIVRRDQQWIAASDDDPFIQEHLVNPAALDLQEFRQQFGNHIEVFVTDRYGAVVATTNRISDYNQADEAWWQAAYADGEGATYISQVPEYDTSVGRFSILLAVPLRNRDTGDFIGVLRSTYDLKDLIGLLTSIRVGQTGEVDILFPGDAPARIHAGGYEIITPEQQAQMLSLTEQPFVQAPYEGNNVFVGSSFVKSTTGEAVINDLGWPVIFHQDVREALSPVNAQTQGTTLISVLIIAVASVLAAGLAQILVVPIRRLTDVAEKVSAGDLAVRAEAQSSDEIGRLAEAFNAMTGQLQGTLQGLEQRVTERTRALETSIQVSRRISTILDQRQLVYEVVEQVRSSFDYYHTHIYLFDDKRENLLMVGGTGEAGRTMLERGHAVPKGRGLVGRAAETNLPVLVPDVTQVEGWLPNPLLPDTKAEAAVPIALGDSVLGVLDVQDDAVNGLSPTDIDLLQAIASQVAIALQNARVYQQAQRQADREALIGNIAQQIQGTASIEEAIQVAARELGRALGTDVGVQLKRTGKDARN